MKNSLDAVATFIEEHIRKPARENLARQLRAPSPSSARRALDFAPFERDLQVFGASGMLRVREIVSAPAAPDCISISIPELHALLVKKALTSHDLSCYFLARIRDTDGALRAVTELNPDALEIARRADAERAAGGGTGLLHGLPVLIKDNIATGDAMRTTAGAHAMAQARADRDAILVSQLRAAGAVILGKTAMTEWANYMTPGLPNGYSGLGGQVRNPYGKYDVSGSSSGSAAAVAAGLCVAAVGTETWGSLTAPATDNSIVALKPTLGWVSQDRIIPITAAQDTAGPMARTVADAAILFQALVDPAIRPPDFFAGLNRSALRGRRVGVVRLRAGVYDDDVALLQRVRDLISSAGGVPVELPAVEFADLNPTRDRFKIIAAYDFKRGLDAYLAATGAPVATLAEVIAFNQKDMSRYAPYGQDTLIAAQNHAISDAMYASTLAESRAHSRRAIDGWLEQSGAEVLVTLSSVDIIDYCAAGYPAICVPLGYRDDDSPIGATFSAAAGQDALLLSVGHAFEGQARARRPPSV